MRPTFLDDLSTAGPRQTQACGRPAADVSQLNTRRSIGRVMTQHKLDDDLDEDDDFEEEDEEEEDDDEEDEGGDDEDVETWQVFQD